MDKKTIAFLVSVVLYGSLVQRAIAQPRLFEEGVISTGDYETHPAFSPSGDTLYFLKGLPDAGFFSICVSYKKNGKWSAPQVASFSGKYTDADPFVARDGKTLYFVSNRPIQEGGPVKPDWDIWKTELTPSGWADIYVSKLINHKYTQAENLGDSINTPDNEYEPYVAPDESFLIFMATYPNGLANADFYISYRVNGKWSKAKRLPDPINSPATEWGGKVTPDSKYFFFGSSRNKITDVLPQREDMKTFELRSHRAGNGLGDIYFIDLSTLKEAVKQHYENH